MTGKITHTTRNIQILNYQGKINLMLVKTQDLTANSQEPQGTEDHTKPYHRDAISKILRKTL